MFDGEAPTTAPQTNNPSACIVLTFFVYKLNPNTQNIRIIPIFRIIDLFFTLFSFRDYNSMLSFYNLYKAFKKYPPQFFGSTAH